MNLAVLVGQGEMGVNWANKANSEKFDNWDDWVKWVKWYSGISLTLCPKKKKNKNYTNLLLTGFTNVSR